MKSRKLSSLVLGMVVVGMLVWGSQVFGAEPIKVKAAGALPESHPGSVGLRYMGEVGSQVSGGLLDFEIFTSGSVGGEGDIVESVSLGTIQIYLGATAPMVSYVPELSVFDLPYLFKDRDHLDRVLWGPVGEAIAELALKKGFRILGWSDSGFQGFYNSKRPITSLADMKGLKMRVMKNTIRIKAMNSYGASAVPVAWPETYGAMETGVVDGCENSYETYRAGSHYEVAKYYTESDHEVLTAVVMVNEQFYQSLPPRLQAVVEHISALGALRYRQLFEEKNIKAKGIVEEKGSITNVLASSMRKDFREAAQPVYDDYVKQFGSDLLKAIEAEAH